MGAMGRAEHGTGERRGGEALQNVVESSCYQNLANKYELGGGGGGDEIQLEPKALWTDPVSNTEFKRSPAVARSLDLC